MNENNAFLSPFNFEILLDKFKTFSSCLTFQNFNEYRNHFPFYLPYGSNEQECFRDHTSIMKVIYYKIAITMLRSFKNV